ncbi:ABC transporter substrate-binding protein [Paenibacillus ginsengarvi]|uniref:Extracellular solute-binding protein n=1 Tax=Paenibacillus ginsengarvi TaxID=400777 RepID=A0A3B0AU65_9BACL|nr:extracellular solute-binding protein [Paenibacillus ginsengarvi]RKN62797.1 extracellular solute-binding protein [Paenibacillus ginsengarvi]
MKRLLTKLALAGLAFSVAGCGAKPDNKLQTNAAAENTTPTTLSLYVQGVQLTDAEFQNFFVEPLKKKLPYITIQLVRDGKGSSPEDLVASGSFPDLVFTSNVSLFRYKKLDVIQDVSSLMKEQSFDASRIQPVVMDAIRSYAGQGETIALPFSLNVAALLYNKDIFDKFGVTYPKDLMTWDDITELSRKLTRQDQGVDYVGFDPGFPDNIGGGLTIDYVDPKTGKANLDNEQWRKVLNTMKQMYEIPGYITGKDTYSYGTAVFLKEKKLAMFATWLDQFIGKLEDMHKKGDIINWDVASFPNYKEALGKGREVDVHLLAVSKLSKHKEQAFRVVKEVLTDEVQTLVSRSGRVSALANPEMTKGFGADLESLKGKHIEGIFKTVPAKLRVPSEFDVDFARAQLREAGKNVALQKADVNTALRQAQEAADKMIASELEKRKK